jgi:hypothetical protein
MRSSVDGSALHAAVRHGHRDVMTWLVGEGADPLQDNSDNMSALHLAGAPVPVTSRPRSSSRPNRAHVTGGPALSSVSDLLGPLLEQVGQMAPALPWQPLLLHRRDRWGRAIVDAALGNPASGAPMHLLLTLYVPAAAAADADPATGATLLHRAALMDGRPALDVLLSTGTQRPPWHRDHDACAHTYLRSRGLGFPPGPT